MLLRRKGMRLGCSGDWDLRWVLLGSCEHRFLTKEWKLVCVSVWNICRQRSTSAHWDIGGVLWESCKQGFLIERCELFGLPLQHPFKKRHQCTLKPSWCPWRLTTVTEKLLWSLREVLGSEGSIRKFCCHVCLAVPPTSSAASCLHL